LEKVPVSYNDGKSFGVIGPITEEEDLPNYLISKHLLDVIKGYAYNQRMASLGRAKLAEQNQNYAIADGHTYSADVGSQIISEINKILNSGIMKKEGQ
jgi:hypothetical protein